MRTCKHWSDDERAIIADGVAHHRRPKQLLEFLPGRSLSGIKWQYRLLLRPQLRDETTKRFRSAYGAISDGLTKVESPTLVPDFVIEERERRHQAAQQRSITAMLCGDPPPGYSA